MGVTSLTDPAGAAPGLPVAADLADLWSEHALACLLDACEVPQATRTELIESGVDAVGREVSVPRAVVDETLEDERLDACRRAVVFAALSLEARLNRVLSRCDPDERRALGRLSPAERFRLAPRLLDELERATENAALCELVEEVFRTRDELVDAQQEEAVAPSPLGPARARGIVEESARVCCFLATLAEDVPVATAVQVWRSARALETRASRLSAGRAPGLPNWDWEWSDGFPPNLVGS